MQILALSWICFRNRTFELGSAAGLLLACAAFSAACGSSADATGPGAGGAGNLDAGAGSGGEMNAVRIA
ncbi:MAG TPA: hypothetical protein VJV79_35100, partial [Polyangiaceae bacterium]|nr:hypothetical protein [Polyangiaceae bacterium]